MKLSFKHRYALLRSKNRAEVAEERAREELSDDVVRDIIEDYLDTVEGDEERLCVDWQKMYKVLKSKA